MTKTQFRHDLRRGLGSCPLELERCANVEDYREDLLWGLEHALAYDAQCEGTRAIYYYDMLCRFDDWSDFHTLIAAGAKRNLKDRGWRFFHFAELLALMAGDAYAPARETLEELYALLLGAIRRGRPSQNGIWPTMDNFSRVCVSLLTNALQTQAEREAFYLRVLSDYGRILARKPDLGGHAEDEWFDSVAEDTLGAERVRELLRQAGNDPDIARYLENRRRLQASREAYRAQAQQQAEAESAQSIYRKLREGAVPGKDLPLHLLRRMEREQGLEEISILAQLYAAEEREDLRHAILRLFRTEVCISTFDDAGIFRLLLDADSENRPLREEALRVLPELRTPQVRDYALSRLERRKKDVDALYMLLTNFRPGDGERLIPLVKAVSLDENRGAWHGVFSAVRELIHRDPAADRELSGALLPYMLREGYCSCCRLYLLELMEPRGLLTPELREECRRDCYLEIRDFVEKQ